MNDVKKQNEGFKHLQSQVWRLNKLRKIARMETVVHGRVSEDVAKGLMHCVLLVEFGLASISLE